MARQAERPLLEFIESSIADALSYYVLEGWIRDFRWERGLWRRTAIPPPEIFLVGTGEGARGRPRRPGTEERRSGWDVLAGRQRRPQTGWALPFTLHLYPGATRDVRPLSSGFADGLLTVEPCSRPPSREGGHEGAYLPTEGDQFILNVALGTYEALPIVGRRTGLGWEPRGVGLEGARAIWESEADRPDLVERIGRNVPFSVIVSRDFVLRQVHLESTLDWPPWPAEEIAAWIYREVGHLDEYAASGARAAKEAQEEEEEKAWVLVDVGVWKNLLTGEIKTSLLEFN